MKTYSEEKIELRNLQFLKKMLEKSSQFLSLDQPNKPKSLDVALNIARAEKYARITCDCGQPGGHSIRVLNGKERKAPAKRSQHANATYRNIVGRNMLHAFGHRVAISCDMLGVVGSTLKMVKFEPTTPNTSQHGGQTHATCCAQQCCDMLSWHLAIVWPGLK